MATEKIDITLDPVVLKRFREIAEEKGMKISPWVNAQMKKFIEEEDKNKKK